MGSGGKGGGGEDLQMTAATNAYNAFGQGQSLDQVNAAQGGYLDANQQAWDRFQQDGGGNSAMMQMLKGMTHSAGNDAASGDAYAAQQAAQDAAFEEARIADLTSKRDAMIGGYFEAANDATSYVTDKIAGEKANAAMMGVDYNMTDELKNERISNYFSSIWSEGSQQEMEGSFGEIGSGGFEQTVWRGEGTEAGPDTGSVGDKQSGGSITAKPKTLIDEENQLGSTSILGAA